MSPSINDYKHDVMYDIRTHLWFELREAGLFNASHYYSDNLGEEIIPIIPVQQMPEMNQFLNGKKHIVYDKIGLSYEENWVICCEQILFTIYSTDLSEISQIRNMMTDVYRRMDETANDLNRDMILSDKYKFYSVFIADISPTTPSEELAGFFSADVILEVKYARTVDEQGRFD
jgi:hypothetical protein